MSITDPASVRRAIVLVAALSSACKGTTATTPTTLTSTTRPTTATTGDTGTVTTPTVWWTVLGPPTSEGTDTTDLSMAILGDRGCVGLPRGWSSYEQEPSEGVQCIRPNDSSGGFSLSAPESATGIDPDRHSADYLRDRAIGFGHTLAPIGDVTGDGTPDLAIGSRDYGRLDLGPDETILDTPDWNYYLYIGWVLTGTAGSDRAVRCGDVTADGQPDLCTTAGFWTGPVGQNPPPTATWPAAEWIAAGDFAGDGTTGLVLAKGSSLWWLTDPGALTGAVDLGSAAAAVFTVAGSVTNLAVGDLDGDGDGVVELVVGTDTQTVVGHLSAAGGFTVAFAWPGRVDALVTGDFDGDGAMDLAVGGDAEVRWFAGPLTSAVEPTAVLRGPGWPDDHVGEALASGDADRDGIWDLGVAAPNPDPEGVGSWWWLEGL